MISSTEGAALKRVIAYLADSPCSSTAYNCYNKKALIQNKSPLDPQFMQNLRSSIARFQTCSRDHNLTL